MRHGDVKVKLMEKYQTVNDFEAFEASHYTVFHLAPHKFMFVCFSFAFIGF